MSRNNGTKTGRDNEGRFANGNPGRPRGARNKATLAAESLLQGQAEALTQAAIKQALQGDTTALRLCLERIAPPIRESAAPVELPPIKTAADLPAAIAALLQAVAAGELAPGEAKTLAAVIGEAGKALELHDFEARLQALEGKQ